MKVLAVIEYGVTVMILGVVALGFLMSLANCIAPESKDRQRARMEPTMEIYRAYNLNPVTIKRHNAELERQALLQYERQARGE